MRTVSLIDMLSRMVSSSRRAGWSSSRWNRIEVCRMRSTRSNTSAPSWSRTVSPRIRPSSRISLRSRASSSSAKASAERLDRRSASEGMIWEDIVGCSRNCPASRVCNFLAQCKIKDGGDVTDRSTADALIRERSARPLWKDWPHPWRGWLTRGDALHHAGQILRPARSQ